MRKTNQEADKNGDISHVELKLRFRYLTQHGILKAVHFAACRVVISYTVGERVSRAESRGESSYIFQNKRFQLKPRGAESRRVGWSTLELTH